MEKSIETRPFRAVVFDSGIGGLNLLSECVKRAPCLDYYYVSDSDHVPYGNRTDDEIFSLTTRALERSVSEAPDVLVIACNTVTARCINRLRERYDFPVVGIQPAVRQAEKLGGKCLVLATESTASSSSLAALVATVKGAEVVVQPCRSLAKYIEDNVFDLPQNLPEGLLPKLKPDTVVLGCTHYAFAKSQIARVYGCSIFDGIGGTAERFLKIVGMSDHFQLLLGKNVHKSNYKPKITFCGGKNVKNKAVFEKIIHL